MPELPILAEQLALVILVGGLIGAEREYNNKSAGFRTMILICLGSYLFTIFSHSIANSTDDRIASNIVTGIGFIGAGVIYKDDNRINGITTAATIWVVAAFGMGIADGAYVLVMASCVIVLFALLFFTKLEQKLDRLNQVHTYRIISVYEESLLKKVETEMDKHGLLYKRVKRIKKDDLLTGVWVVRGTAKKHSAFLKQLLHDPGIKELEF